jgi:hypothetical protein
MAYRRTRRDFLSAAAGGILASRPAWALSSIPRGAGAFAPPLDEARPISAFGPLGSNDDTATFNRWLQSGEPARFDATVYYVAGPLRDAGAPSLRGYGLPGRTIFRRPAGLTAISWVNLAAAEQWLYGIVWDMNGQTGGNGWGVEFTPSAHRIRLERCAFLNNKGGNLATGAVIQGRARAADQDDIEVVDCEASGNVGHGLWLVSVAGASVVRGAYHHNVGYGLNVNPASTNPDRFPAAERVTIFGATAHHNGNAGIVVGSYDRGEGGRHIFDPANTFDAIDVTIQNVQTSFNGGYGIAIAARRSLVQDCVSTRDGGDRPDSGLAGIGAGGVGSRLLNCRVSGRQTFGFDAGALLDGVIENCASDGPATAFNLGSFRNLICRGLRASNFSTLLNCERVELADEAFGDQFPIAGDGLLIEDVTADVTGSFTPGLPARPIIVLLDNPQNVRINRLDILDPQHRTSAAAPLAWALSDSFSVDAFSYNGSGRVVLDAPNGLLLVPDHLSVVEISGRPTIREIRGWTQAQLGDGIAWWNIRQPAEGLSAQPRLEISAEAGVGRQLKPAEDPLIETSGGKLSGLFFGGGRAHGGGYRRASAKILPTDGQGAAGLAEAQIGAPVSQGTRLTLKLPGGGIVLGQPVVPGGTITVREKDGAWTLCLHAGNMGVGHSDLPFKFGSSR